MISDTSKTLFANSQIMVGVNYCKDLEPADVFLFHSYDWIIVQMIGQLVME